MGNDIGNIARNVAQIVFPNEKPLKRSTGSVRLILMQSDLMQKRLGGCMVAEDVSLEMFWQLCVQQEVDAKERDEKLKVGREEKCYLLRLVKLTREPGNDESGLLSR